MIYDQNKFCDAFWVNGEQLSTVKILNNGGSQCLKYIQKRFSGKGVMGAKHSTFRSNKFVQKPFFPLSRTPSLKCFNGKTDHPPPHHPLDLTSDKPLERAPKHPSDPRTKTVAIRQLEKTINTPLIRNTLYSKRRKTAISFARSGTFMVRRNTIRHQPTIKTVHYNNNIR